jgi:hypothetical protein
MAVTAGVFAAMPVMFCVLSVLAAMLAMAVVMTWPFAGMGLRRRSTYYKHLNRYRFLTNYPPRDPIAPLRLPPVITEAVSRVPFA